MFTATLTVSDLDFDKPEDAAVALLAAAGNARPLSVALHHQHTGAKHLVSVDDFPDIPAHALDGNGLARVISFLEGFEGDELQEGIPELIAAAKKADDLLRRNLNAWEDEEDSVQEEHSDLITTLRAFLENSEPPKPHKISILWGEAHEEGDRAETYEFATQAELDAFLEGVEAMDGWLAWEVVDEGYVWRSEYVEEDEAEGD